jgi:cell division protease FtsH
MSKVWWTIGIIALLALVVGFVIEEASRPEPMPYSTFLDQLDAGNIASVTFKATKVDGIFKRPVNDTVPTGTAQRGAFTTFVPDVGDPTLMPALRAQRVIINVNVASGWTWLLGSIPFPILIFLGVFVVGGLVRLVRGGKARPNSATSMHPMGGMIKLASGLFAKRTQAEGTSANDGEAKIR